MIDFTLKKIACSRYIYRADDEQEDNFRDNALLGSIMGTFWSVASTSNDQGTQTDWKCVLAIHMCNQRMANFGNKVCIVSVLLYCSNFIFIW
jgi:hypothetical protein